MATEDEANWNREEFGRLLRAVREAQGRTTRSVAGDVGLSHGHLAKLERAEWKRPPTTELLQRLAATLQLDPRELAGVGRLELVFRRPSAGPLTAAEQFSRLMLDPDFGPRDWKPAFLDHVPPLHRRMIVELAVNAFQRGVAVGRDGRGRRLDDSIGVGWGELVGRGPKIADEPDPGDP